MTPWRIIAALAALWLCVSAAQAQSNRGTLNWSAKITTGNTFQTLRPAEQRWSITIQNNNASDNCYLIVGGNQVTPGTTTVGTNVTTGGGTVTAQQAAILLTPGLPWQRYYPYVPNDAIYATCASTGDSLYVDTQ
jgi:hypothetical protein